MLVQAENRKGEAITNAVKRLGPKAKRKRADGTEAFIRHFYEDVPPGDIADEQAGDLYGAAISIRQFAAKRTPGQAKVRAYNPRVEKHGWHARHTVVEIINDDMPFLVDSVTMELNRLGLGVHLVIHPQFDLVRDRAGNAKSIHPGRRGPKVALRESIMHVDVDVQTAPEILKEIETGVLQVLGDVRAAVTDWRLMKARVEEIIEELTNAPPKLKKADVQEAIAFLNWVNDDHFTLLGIRDTEYEGRGRNSKIKILPKGALGVLQDPKVRVFAGLRNLGRLPVEIQEFVRQPRLLRIAKSNRRSTVHRRVHMDTIGVKKFDARGKVTGEHLIIGLFTSAAYSQSPREIPLLRRKVAEVIRMSGFDPQSHAGKALQNIVETFPRDELLQIDAENLLEIGRGVIHLQDRQRIALFLRRDAFERFISAFIYIPRDRYTTALRLTFEDIISKAFNGTIAAHFAHLTEDVLGRLHLIVSTTPGAIPDFDQVELEAQLIEAARGWGDWLSEALVEEFGEEKGNALLYRYGKAFPTSYCEQFHAQAAVFDIQRIEQARTERGLSMNLYRPAEAERHQVKFKIYNVGEPVPLSNVLPMLENMGLDVISEVPYEVAPTGSESNVYIHDFLLHAGVGEEIPVDEVRQSFHDTFGRVWRGDMEDDGFNRLVLHAGLGWRDVIVLRAYCKFLRQAGVPTSQEYMEETLATHHSISRLLVDLFHVRFDPDGERNRKREVEKVAAQIDKRLADVQVLDEDRMLRRFLNLIQATLRTNYFQHDTDGEPKPYFSIKLDSQNVDVLPEPKPFREIFVHSPRFEAVHLRFGKVARGGLRLSDRREDFRTEVLGLVKAQQVKNAVIVPVGAKGGFILKKAPPPSDREARFAEGVACYKSFISAMLEITDNLKHDKSKDKIEHPERTVRWDGNHTYLVVAADKGTATFSDFANEVAVSHGYWLGDAFASGGSAGYDHKKMGITARGGWESVKRHFRELEHNTQTEDFTVVGVGDMSGDVFGNSMLLSRHIKLVGAFDHRHIFIDPDPDPKTSFTERKRLFALPRSSWADYNRKLISKGGGIFERKAKSISLTPQMKALFGIDDDQKQLAPDLLLHRMLLAEVDLLWFGGIGTYVKAKSERDLDVGDRANDDIRVNGGDLRCRVVGEGANLGVTQRGRVEFARTGGRINTDAIDNSAGVDCSDHEVNIKILLGDVVRSGGATLKQRNALLVRMTDEVKKLVLVNSYRQTQAISIALPSAPALLGAHQRQMHALEKTGELDRGIEFLPNDEEIDERFAADQGLTSPEIAVLQAYAKIAVYDALMESDLPKDKYLNDVLTRYFPAPLQKKYAESIARHRLRREIIAEEVTNSIVDRAGSTFVTEMQNRTGKSVHEITRAYIIVREAFELRSLWEEIEALDNKVKAKNQIAMLQQTVKTVERTTQWMLREGKAGLDIKMHIDRFEPGIRALRKKLWELLAHKQRKDLETRTDRYVQSAVSKPLAERIGQLKALSSALDIVKNADETKRPVEVVGRTYFLLGEELRLDALRHQANSIVPDNPWHALAKDVILDDYWGLQGRMASSVVTKHGDSEDPIEAWRAKNPESDQRIKQILNDFGILNDPPPKLDLFALTVVSRRLRAVVDKRR